MEAASMPSPQGLHRPRTAVRCTGVYRSGAAGPAMSRPRRSAPAASPPAALAVLWAAYSFVLGRLGGQAFEHNPWAGLVVALGTTVVLSALVEMIRRIVSRWRRSARPPAGADT